MSFCRGRCDGGNRSEGQADCSSLPDRFTCRCIFITVVFVSLLDRRLWCWIWLIAVVSSYMILSISLLPYLFSVFQEGGFIISFTLFPFIFIFVAINSHVLVLHGLSLMLLQCYIMPPLLPRLHMFIPVQSKSPMEELNTIFTHFPFVSKLWNSLYFQERNI